MRYVLAILFTIAAALVCDACYYAYLNGQLKRMAIENNTVAKMASLAMIRYLQDHKGRFPDARTWEDKLRPYWLGSPFKVRLEALPGAPPHRLAMNRHLSSVSNDNIAEPGSVIMFYETAATERNARGEPKECLEWVADWHYAPPAVACGDGHVGYGWAACGSSEDFQYSSDPKAMGLAK